MKWRGKPEEAKVLNTPPKVLAITDGDFFPNIKQLFYLISTLAVTSAECECSVSRLRHLKTYLRSTMLEDRLNGLAMYIETSLALLKQKLMSLPVVGQADSN